MFGANENGGTLMDQLDEIFKAYDVRGKVGSQLTEEVLHNIGRAFADWLPEEGVVAVGYDMRPDSKAFAEALIAGLTLQGRDVWNIGRIATDMIYFAVGSNNLAGGAVVTASHNPGEYNGIKLSREDAKPIGDDSGLFEIRDAIKTGTYKTATRTGSVESKSVLDGWIDHVLSFVDTTKLTPISLAVDAGNGMGGEIFAELEPYVPWVVTEMYFEPDGTFPNHEANPLKFETLKDIIAVIQKDKLDGGIAFDGDGDRAFLLDETGTVLPAGALQAMLSEYFLQKYPGSKIIAEVRSSRTVREVVEEFGGIPVITKAGHSNIKKAMREQNAPFGSEASGHYFFKDNWYADSGLLAAVIGLYVATLSGKTLSELRKQYTKYAAIPETNFEVTDKAAAMKAIEALYPNVTPDRLDGITLDFGNGAWLNARPSNTEPLLRLNVEAKTQAEVDVIVAKVKTVLK